MVAPNQSATSDVHNAALFFSPTLPLQELGLDMPQGSQDEEGAAHQSLTQVGSPLSHLHPPNHVTPAAWSYTIQMWSVAAMLYTPSLCLALCSTPSACLILVVWRQQGMLPCSSVSCQELSCGSNKL